MKRTIAFLLGLTMVLSLCACGGISAKKQELFESFAWGTSMKEVEEALTAKGIDYNKKDNTISYDFETVFSCGASGIATLCFSQAKDGNGEGETKYGPLFKVVVIVSANNTDDFLAALKKHYGNLLEGQEHYETFRKTGESMVREHRITAMLGAVGDTGVVLEGIDGLFTLTLQPVVTHEASSASE